MTPRVVSFTVPGIAQPKGSTRAVVAQRHALDTPRAVVLPDNPRGAEWQTRVAWTAKAMTRGVLFEGAVALTVAFYLPRPRSLSKRVLGHVRKPDLDKLVRCTKDALTGVVYRDDAQVVELHAEKHYAGDADAPHANITIAG